MLVPSCSDTCVNRNFQSSQKLRFSRLTHFGDFRNNGSMDVVDGKWIEARLTGKHGELKKLADAIGIEPAKVTKILKGKRNVQPDELPRLLAYFGTPPVGGFDDKPAAYIPKSISPIPIDSRVADQLAPQVVRPVAFRINLPMPAYALLSGDVLIIDPSPEVEADGLVLVNLWNDHGDGETVIRRRFGKTLLSCDPCDAEPMIPIDGSPRIGIHGVIVATHRTYITEKAS